MVESPCHYCDKPEKCATCHVDCPEYVAFEIVNAVERERRYKEKEKDNRVYSQRKRSVIRQLRKRRT